VTPAHLKDLEIDKEDPVGRDRLIAPKAAEHYGAFWGTYGGEKCHVYPYEGGAKVKLPGKKFLTVGSPKGLFGQPCFAGGTRRVYVTEGELDALAVRTAVPEQAAVSVRNGAGSAAKDLRDSLQWLTSFDEIVLAFDNDEPGRKAIKECLEFLPPGRTRVVRAWPDGCKDACDVLRKGKKALAELLYGAEVSRPAGVLSGDDLWERVANYKLERGARLPILGLDEKLHGLRPGEITLFAAAPGAGKTTLVQNIAASFVALGDKVGILALEESAERCALRYLSAAVGRSLHLAYGQDLTEYKVAWHDSGLSDGIVIHDHDDPLTSQQLFGRLEYMVRGLGCRLVVLDPITIIASMVEDARANERQDLDRMMARLSSFVRATQCHVFVVCHLNGGKGKDFELGAAIAMGDLRGSRSLEIYSMNIVGIERNSQAEDEEERNQVTLRVLKCRHTGFTGHAGTYRFDAGSSSLVPVNAGFGLTPETFDNARDPERGEQPW
jgi:twinkle protein